MIEHNPQTGNQERNRRFYLENREREIARSRAYYAANRDARIAYAKANRHISRKACAKWAAANIEKIRSIQHRRRARKKAAGGSYTPQEAAEIFKLQRGRCAYCKIKLRGEKHLDHITPIAAGGRNDKQNLQWLCAPCNHSKSDRDPLDFARQLGALL